MRPMFNWLRNMFKKKLFVTSIGLQITMQETNWFLRQFYRFRAFIVWILFYPAININYEKYVELTGGISDRERIELLEKQMSELLNKKKPVELVEVTEPTQPKKKRGRPAGSKNKPKAEQSAI